jgi:hypothetical protein
MANRDQRKMKNEDPNRKYHGVTQEKEWNVEVALGVFIRAWCQFRGDPASHELYCKTKESLKDIERLIEKEWKERK